jgi:hypothetical protein
MYKVNAALIVLCCEEVCIPRAMVGSRETLKARHGHVASEQNYMEVTPSYVDTSVK